MQHFEAKKLVIILFIAIYTKNVRGRDRGCVVFEKNNAEPQKSAKYIFNAKLSHCNTLNSENSFCHFFIENKHRTILKQPNRIEYIKFNNSQLALNHAVKLPDILDWSIISVYTHKNTIPLLIQIISSKRAYFYSPDPEAGKWTTHIIDKLSKYKEVDRDGAVCYNFNNRNDEQEAFAEISEECLRLSERFRNDHDTTGNTTKDPSLEICIKLTEILRTSAPLAEDEHFTRPKLELSSFRGEGNVRIQTYSLEVEAPVARAILVHGYMCNFQSAFLNFNPKYFDSINPALRELVLYYLNVDEKRTKLRYKYGDDLVSAEELKPMVCGQIQLEDRSIYIYEDGTDGWATTDRYVYEGSPAQALNLNGISVHGLDLRSFGASGLPKVMWAGQARALIDDFDNISKDLITFIKILREKYNDDLPIYLTGVSMGGAAVARALELLGNEKLVDGAILIAPMLKPVVGGKYNTFYKYFKWLAEAVAFFVGRKQVKTWRRTCKNDNAQSIETDDECRPHSLVYLRTAIKILRGCNDSFQYSCKINGEIPLLLIHSTHDDRCAFEGTEEFFNTLTQVKNKIFIRLSNLGHWETISHRHFIPFCDLIIEWLAYVNRDY